jgi:hypothetical protein
VTSVAFVSPAHGRFAVTALVLAQRRRLIRELAAGGIDAISIIVADDENLDIAHEYGCQTVEAPNLPLGRKCNVGLQAAAGQAEHVVWIGSDDWIHPDVFQPLLNQPRSRPMRIIAGRSMAIVNLPVGRLQRVASPSKYGAVPWLLDSRLLRTHKRDWVRPDLNHGLDGALIRGLRLTRPRYELVFHDPHPFRCVDFKTPENITPYRGLAKHLGTHPEQQAWSALEAWYPADLVDLARATAAGHRQGGRRPMRLIHPDTGETVRVSRAGAEVLRKRGWMVPGAPKPSQGKKKLAATKKTSAPEAAERTAEIETAGHTPEADE